MEPTGDCNKCPFWKTAGHKVPGKKIPGGYGKCIYGGECRPETVRTFRSFTGR
jgi:hypothetical protein